MIFVENRNRCCLLVTPNAGKKIEIKIEEQLEKVDEKILIE